MGLPNCNGLDRNAQTDDESPPWEPTPPGRITRAYAVRSHGPQVFRIYPRF